MSKENLFTKGLGNNFDPYVSAYTAVAQMVKKLPAMQEAWVQSLSWKDSLEKEMAMYSILFLPEESHG